MLIAFSNIVTVIKRIIFFQEFYSLIKTRIADQNLIETNGRLIAASEPHAHSDWLFSVSVTVRQHNE